MDERGGPRAACVGGKKRLGERLVDMVVAGAGRRPGTAGTIAGDTEVERRRRDTGGGGRSGREDGGGADEGAAGGRASHSAFAGDAQAWRVLRETQPACERSSCRRRSRKGAAGEALLGSDVQTLDDMGTSARLLYLKGLIAAAVQGVGVSANDCDLDGAGGGSGGVSPSRCWCW